MDMKVCVAGLGEVGLPTARYILSKGIEVWGYDINDDAVKRAKEQGIDRATSDWNELPSMDVYVVCVSTSIERDGTANLAPVFNICEKISRKACELSLVSIESTILPSTSRRIHKEVFREKLALVHVPHRYWADDPLKHGVKQLRVIGAVNKKSLAQGIRFYKDFLRIPLYVASSIEVAEMSKITENALRYVQIAFAEELKMICQELGLRFEDVQKACNTKWNVEILEARDGIKRRCLPKDIGYLISLSGHNTLLKSAVSADESYSRWKSLATGSH